jgi:hypothetical protein
MADERHAEFKNARDAHGWPICPACDKPIAPDAATARSQPYLAHRECWDRVQGGKPTRLSQSN